VARAVIAPRTLLHVDAAHPSRVLLPIVPLSALADG